MPDAPPRKLPPVWLLGLTNAPLGLTGGAMLLTLPQLLAARHVPEPVIAQLTTLALAPTFLVFLAGPVLDVRFSRRTYAVAATLLSALATAAAFLSLDHLGVLAAAMFVSVAGAALNNVAGGGWFGSLVRKEDDATLGSWFTVANVGSFGLIAMAALPLVRVLPPAAAAGLVGAAVLLPLPIYALTPAPAADARLSHERFSRFAGELAAVVRRPTVLRLLMLFIVPAASFALTNTLGGLGRDYGASEGFVSLVGGAAVTGAGVFGGLLIPPLARRAPARWLYVGIGTAGALFTLLLLLAPHTPAVFAAAMIGENVAQSAALATVNVVALQSLGEDNPFAATQYGLLVSAASLPITYMQLLDGHAYGAGGLALMYLADAGLGLLACALMAALLLRWRARDAAEAAPLAIPGDPQALRP